MSGRFALQAARKSIVPTSSDVRRHLAVSGFRAVDANGSAISRRDGLRTRNRERSDDYSTLPPPQARSWRHAPSVRNRTIFSKIPRSCSDNSIVAACFLAIMTSLAEKMPKNMTSLIVVFIVIKGKFVTL
jgi:hypothetical protein